MLVLNYNNDFIYQKINVFACNHKNILYACMIFFKNIIYFKLIN